MREHGFPAAVGAWPRSDDATSAEECAALRHALLARHDWH
mgnify:CR=1 FL=1